MTEDQAVTLTRTTILSWVQRNLSEFEKRWNGYACPVGGSRRMDETYVRARGQWV